MNRLTYALLAFGLMGNAASALAQAPAAASQPTGSLLYTVTIPVDDVPANNIVFQGVETYIPGGGYIETDQLSFSPTLGFSTPSHGTWTSSPAPLTDFLMTYLNFTYDSMGTQQGMGKVRQLATISADGLTYKGGGDFAYLDSNGAVLLAGTFTITATRIQAQKPQPMTSAQTVAQQLQAYGGLRRVLP